MEYTVKLHTGNVTVEATSVTTDETTKIPRLCFTAAGSKVAEFAMSGVICWYEKGAVHESGQPVVKKDLAEKAAQAQ